MNFRYKYMNNFSINNEYLEKTNKMNCKTLNSKKLTGTGYKVTVLITSCILASCHNNSEWRNIEYNSSLADSNRITHCEKGDQIYQKAHVFLEQDTLFIDFFDPPPAGWEGMLVKIYAGKFCATAYGNSFLPVDLSCTTMEQHLQLDKKRYALNDTLYGYCNFHIQSIETSMSIDKEEKKDTATFSFCGNIHEIIRTKDFNPFDEANFMTFDLPVALLELGEPIDREKFNTLGLPEFRIELLNLFPAGENVWIEEATWDVGNELSIAGDELDRLTIWYAQTDSIHWKPVLFTRWNQFTQF